MSYIFRPFRCSDSVLLKKEGDVFDLSVLRSLKKVKRFVALEESGSWWFCTRNSGGAEKHVRVGQDMCGGSETVMRCLVGVMDKFKGGGGYVSTWL